MKMTKKQIHLETFSEPEKVEALAAILDCSVLDIEEGYDSDNYEADGAEYLVLTDDEADKAWNESLDSYIDECILPELPKYLQNYFDDERWKSDAQIDGRGHSLNHYDGTEEYEEINGTDYYIYRTN